MVDGRTRTGKVVNQLKNTSYNIQKQADAPQLQDFGGMIMPNHSGISSHPEFLKYLGDYAKITDLNSYVLKAGDTMTGQLLMDGGNIRIAKGNYLEWSESAVWTPQQLAKYSLSWDATSPFNVFQFFNTIEDGNSPLIFRGLYLVNTDYTTGLTSGSYSSLGVLISSGFGDLIEEGSTTRTYQGYAHSVGNIFDIGGTGNISTVGFSASSGNLLNFGSGTWTGKGYVATGYGNSALNLGQAFYSDGGDIVIQADGSTRGKFICGAGLDAGLYYDGTDLVINSALVGSGTLKFNTANNWTANGTNTVTISNVAPSGVGTATISKWFTVKDNAGTTFYIPAWT